MAGKSAGVSLGTINERRLRPVYDHLDNGNNKNAVHEADKVLKKQKDLSAAKVLKTIALYRLGRVEEAFTLSQEVILTGPTDENSLQGLTLYYRESHRTDLIPPMYEIALAKCPGNEEYMTHLFMSYVRMGKPKDMQRVAINLFKHHPKNPYLFWGVMSIVMQANENKNLAKAMFLPLAEKMIEKHIEKGKLEAEAETRLYLMVLDSLGKYEKAMQVLESEAKTYFLMNKDSIQEMITDLNRKMEKWELVNSSAKKLFRKNPDIWNYTLDYLDSLEHLIEAEWKSEESDESLDVDSTWEAAIDLFLEIKNIEIADNSDRPRRGPHLAVLELVRRMKENPVGSPHPDCLGNSVELILDYAKIFSSKPCCFSDLKIYIQTVSNEDKSKILERLNHLISSSFSNGDEKPLSNGEVDDKAKEKEIQSHLSYVKLQRYLGYHDVLSREEKLDLVSDFLQRHQDGLKYSEYRPATDLRVVDDYCLLAANILHDIYLAEGDVEFAWRALYVLELAKQKSETNYKFKFMLIHLYCDFGIFMPCAQIYDSLDIKHVQQDTLGYLICNSVSSLGHYQLASQAYEASRAFFLSNEKDSLEFLISCFKNGSFHKVPEFVSFRKRVKSSIQATHTLLEHTYMDLVTQADIEMPLSELMESSCLPEEMTNFDELADNRDFTLSFDWTAGDRSSAVDYVQTSFRLEKKWLRFREMQVRSLLKLLAQEQTEGDEISTLLRHMEESIEAFNDPDVRIKIPRHGPPRSRIAPALDVGYPTVVHQLLKLFAKILNEGSECDQSLEKLSKSVISGITDSISALSGCTKQETKHERCHSDDNDVRSSVMSQEPVKSALKFSVPDSLKELNRSQIERLVLTSEMFSQSVLLLSSFRSFVAQIKSDAMKKRRRKKGKPEPLPFIVQFYQRFSKELEETGAKLKSVIKQMQSNAEVMTLDLSKASMQEKIPNGVSTKEEPVSAVGEISESEIVYSPDVPGQLVKMASESLLNATKQLCNVVNGRLKNLKAIKI